MHLFERRLPEHRFAAHRLRLLIAALLLAAALGGYLAGHRRSSPVAAAPEAQTHTILTSSLLLAYPSSWAPVAAGTKIPGLSISSPAALAPGGDRRRAGLLTGQLLGGEPSPLPARFLARLRRLPDTKVVQLAETQAYRYTKLSVVGFDRAFTLYAIPNPGGSPTAVACYASSASSADMRTCEQIVASLRLQFAPQSYILTPDTGYARRVSASLRALEARRAAVRRGLQALGPQPAAHTLATRLALALAGTSSSLATLQAPPAASLAQARLATALQRAGSAYTTLAGAAAARDRAGYVTARSQVYAAESSVRTALESFALLGYGGA